MITILLTTVCAFLLCVLVMHFLIPALRALKAGQSIREIGPSWHNSKAGTPTMGGLGFMLAATVCVVAFGWPQMLHGKFDHLFILGFALIYGAIGFIDDFVKVKLKRNLGLTALQKLALQLAAAGCYLALMRYNGNLTTEVYVPFLNTTFSMHWILYLVFAMFVIVGGVNAVNLTDGVDGLATGVTLPVMLFFTVAAWSQKMTAVSIVPAAMVGALAGFLCYNFHPAKVFMGDTGSLFLGGLVCGLAFALDMPLILLLVGFVYIAETLSVILQVIYFKLTHGKRLFRMSPLHHHYEMGGWSEKKIFTVFTSVTALMCVLAYLSIMGR